jgi:hypothetical protein
MVLKRTDDDAKHGTKESSRVNALLVLALHPLAGAALGSDEAPEPV